MKVRTTAQEMTTVIIAADFDDYYEHQHTSFDDLVNHAGVTICLLQLRGSDPDLPISRDVFSCLVQHLACIVIAFQSRQR